MQHVNIRSGVVRDVKSLPDPDVGVAAEVVPAHAGGDGRDEAAQAAPTAQAEEDGRGTELMSGHTEVMF